MIPTTTRRLAVPPAPLMRRSANLASARLAEEARPDRLDFASPGRGRAGDPPPATAAGRAGEAAAGGRRPRVLVVDDEQDLVELISMNLARAGFETAAAADGDAALAAAFRDPPDLVLLDLMLPGVDGVEVARRLRADARTARVPIVMLTARAEETDVVVGLTLGADDYVTKPFSPKVLVARCRAVLRRAAERRPEAQADGAKAGDAGGAGQVLRAGPLTMDVDKHEVAVAGKSVRLTLTEFRLLLALVEARGRVMSRNRLMDKAMGADIFVTDRAIDVHVTAIRKKLGEANWLVHTVRGVGYRLQEEPGDA